MKTIDKIKLMLYTYTNKLIRTIEKEGIKVREVKIIRHVKLYKFDELSTEAKEKVKKWYLDGQEPYIFAENITEQLSTFFPNSDLKVQFSLNYCQGDGVNIHGNVSMKDLLNFKKFKNEDINYTSPETFFTDKELKALKFYSEIVPLETIKLPQNLRYCYCMVNKAEIAEMISDTLYDMRMVEYDILLKFEQFTQNIITALCKEIEKDGYNYFYEVDEEELKEFCNSEKALEFLEDGTVFEVMELEE